MKQSKSHIAGIVAVSILLGSASAAWAFGGGKGDDCRRGPMQAIEKIDGITDEQVNQVEALFQQQRDKREQMRDARDAERENMKKIMSGAASDKDIQQAAKEAGERASLRVTEMAAVQKQLAAILSPEQMKQLAEMRDEFRKDAKHGHFGHGRWGDDDDDGKERRPM